MLTALTNTELVEEMILNKKDQSGAHSKPEEIARELNINRRSVYRIFDQDLEETSVEKRMIRLTKVLSKYTPNKFLVMKVYLR